MRIEAVDSLLTQVGGCVCGKPCVQRLHLYPGFRLCHGIAFGAGRLVTMFRILRLFVRTSECLIKGVTYIARNGNTEKRKWYDIESDVFPFTASYTIM